MNSLTITQNIDTRPANLNVPGAIRFQPNSARDQQIIETLAAAGFIVIHGFPVWKDNRFRLRGHRRLIVPGGAR